MKKCIFQLVSHQHGIRTPIVASTPAKFAEAITKGGTEDWDKIKDDYVVVLMEQNDEGDYDFSVAPLMTVASFVAMFPFVDSDEVTL